MLANMATSLIVHKKITTTIAKAKALRTYVEPLITKSKDDSTHSRRIVFSYLQDKKAVAELFREISPKIGERPGGYTRILKTGNRIGDNADMCIIELVDYNEAMLAGEAAKTKTARRRRSKKKAETVVEAKAPKTRKEPETVAEVVDAVEEVVAEIEAEITPESVIETVAEIENSDVAEEQAVSGTEEIPETTEEPVTEEEK
jgi:large subunit ribosomal protein L17